MKHIFYPFFLIGVIVLSSCSQIQKVTDIVVQPTAREVYARGFEENDSLFNRWKLSLSNAKINRLQAVAPFTLQGKFNSHGINSYGYKVPLQEGERLIVEINQDVDSFEVFIDVFQCQNDSTLIEKPLASSEIDKKNLSVDIEDTANYKIVVQPEIANTSAFNIKIYTQPMFSFPVSGYENQAIQSFWGASRDAGKRSHEGVDIFAKRGTPVVAVTDGFVSFTGERGLGGKQVWQRAGLLGKSIYYAHLDSVAVGSASRVKLGDTLGFVGNTGNARTTAPHLHFGIYTTGGAINPLPFIKTQVIPDDVTALIGNTGVTKQRQNQLRLGPKVSYDKVATLASKDTLQIIGKVDDWYHVKSDENVEGFMHRSLLSIQ